MLIDRRNYLPPDDMNEDYGLPIRWWLLLPVLGALAVLAWGFVAIYCDPAPNALQVTSFIVLLALIFLETLDAGFYTSRS